MGIVACIGFIGLLFYGERTAALLGWPPNTPWQLEVGAANLALSIAGLLCIWQRKGFWLATASFASVYYLDAACGRSLQMVGGLPSLYETYPALLFDDIGIPLAYLGLAIVYAYHNKFFRS